MDTSQHIGAYLSGCWCVLTILKNMTSSMGRMTSHIWHGKQTSCSKPPTSYDIPFIMVIYKSVLNPIKTPICCWFQTTNQLWLTSYFFSCRLSSPVGFPPRYLSFASSGVWPASLGAAVGTSSCSPFSVVEASATGQRWQGQIKQQNMPQKKQDSCRFKQHKVRCI